MNKKLKVIINKFKEKNGLKIDTKTKFDQFFNTFYKKSKL